MKNAKCKMKNADALEILDRMIGDDQEIRAMIDEAEVNMEIAQMIYDARAEAGLTQKQLADLVGTSQSVIARLEDADYGRHSLRMLQRVAKALNRRVSFRLDKVA